MRAHPLGVLDPLQLLDGGFDQRVVDDGAFLGECAQQRRVAEDVDQPRDAARVAEDEVASGGLEDLSPFRAGDLEAVRDVFVRLALGKRAQMEPQTNALSELLQSRRIELVRQLRLARDDDAHQLLLAQLEAGEETHFFEHLARQVLRFVDDQQDLLAGRVLLDHEVFEHREQLDLALAERLETELDEQRLQELDGRKLRLADVREHDVVRQLGEESSR